MKVIEDTRFFTPHQIHPVYNGQMGKFVFQLRLDNQLECPLHFYIASTFGCCLQQTSKTRFVGAQTFATLTFQLKHANILGNVSEMIVIYGSKYQSVQLFSLDNCYQARTELTFNGDNSTDPEVQQILKISFEEYIKEANQFKIKSDYVNSLRKYEEAYEIIRTSDVAVKGMIETRFMLQDFAGAMRDLESVLTRRVDDPLCFLIKVKLIMKWQKEIISERQEIYDYIETALKHISQHFHFYFLGVQDKAQYQNLVKQFKSYKRNLSGRANRLLKYVYSRAIDKFQQSHPIAKHFPSKKQLEQELKQLLLDQNNKQDFTPQQVLDPISYQIMKKPYILPSGNSFEQKSLRDYFKINGYKDPITRMPINYNFIFQNLNLEKYIKENPKLKTWERYEYDFIHN